MTDQPRVWVVTPAGEFEITDDMLNQGWTGVGSFNRWELALTDSQLIAYGQDPAQFRIYAANGQADIRINGYPGLGLDDGPYISQMYLSLTTTPEQPCEQINPAVSAHQLVVHERDAEGVLTSHGFMESDVVGPGSIYFHESGGPAWYANGVTNQLQLNPTTWTGSDADPISPLITIDGLLEMTAQIKFPASIDPEPDWVESWMAVEWGGVQYQWVGPYGNEPGGNAQYRGADGVWRIPFLYTDGDYVYADTGEWTLEKMLNGLNDPDPGTFNPMLLINFGWLADVWGSPRISILEPFTDMGLAFRYCEVEEPVEVLVGVAPPLRIYPRHDQSAMGTPRVFPKSPSRQHGNRVGPGSYT